MAATYTGGAGQEAWAAGQAAGARRHLAHPRAAGRLNYSRMLQTFSCPLAPMRRCLASKSQPEEAARAPCVCAPRHRAQQASQRLVHATGSPPTAVHSAAPMLLKLLLAYTHLFARLGKRQQIERPRQARRAPLAGMPIPALSSRASPAPWCTSRYTQACMCSAHCLLLPVPRQAHTVRTSQVGNR